MHEIWFTFKQCVSKTEIFSQKHFSQLEMFANRYR